MAALLKAGLRWYRRPYGPQRIPGAVLRAGGVRAGRGGCPSRGQVPEDFVRDAALAAADDPFLRALRETRDRVPLLAEVFATQDTRTADGGTDVWPDPAPLGSRDLHEGQLHGHAA